MEQHAPDPNTSPQWMRPELTRTEPRPAAPDLDTAPQWMRAQLAARVIGVSVRTIRRWDRSGLIRTSRPAGPGGVVLICRDSLRELVERGASTAA